MSTFLLYFLHRVAKPCVLTTNEVNFFVDDIKPINWNDDAYDHLVYHEEQKDLVLSFVDNHKRLRHGVHDVIIGKGQGLIVLLSGPPGTGKTLTAEAGKIADCTSASFCW